MNKPKYRKGDRILINIIEDAEPEGVNFYRIDDGQDGTPRYMSEGSLDKVVELGGDVYTVREFGMEDEA